MPLSLFSINQKSILALLLGGLIALAAGAALAGNLEWMPDWIENNNLDFGGFSNFIDAAAGAKLTEEETRAMIVALINSKFGDQDFLTVLREQNASAATKLENLANAKTPSGAIFKQELEKINSYAKNNPQAQIDKQNIQKQITAAAANSNENKAQAIKDYQAKIDTGTATEKDKEAYIAALKASGDTIVTDPLTGKSWAYSSYDPSDPKNEKGKNMIDTAAQFSLDTGYDPCLDGFMVGGGDEGGGSGSGSGSGNASVVCNTYIYNDWGACAGGTQSRTIFSKGPSGCTDTSSAQLTQSCAVSCTSYTYSDWSACSNGSQSRTIKTQSPAGCTNTSSADLTNDCTGNDGTTCTSYTYSDWSACSNGSQSRTIKTQSPAGCTNTSSADLAQSCTVQTAVCDSYTYSDWSACVNGGQTRSMISRVPAECTDTSSAIFTQSCGIAQPPIVANTTNAVQISSNPVLSVTTNQAAVCQYAEAGGFSYGNGATFNTTGGYNHNTGLNNVNSGQHTFYVICKDNATGGISTALKIDFNVDLSLDPASAPVIVSATPAKQTGSNPVLSITTDRPAACQYKKDAVFAYGAGVSISTTDNYSHSVSISSLADGSYNFYAVCKDKTTGAVSAAKQISTAIDRSGNNPAAPALVNNTDTYQTVNNPILAVSTDKAAVCQYGSGSFTYGAGIQFATDGGTSHSVQLSNIANGQHTYYVICKDAATGAVSNAGYQIIFTVDVLDGDNCADLSSNDRKSDSNRSNSGGGNANSSYLWQSVETGTRERFSDVDWYAGYQFTPEKDGRITQLCGYFDSGATNKVSIYNGSYAEIASAQVAGNDSWKCVDISPLEIDADSRYYVIARVQNNPIYFEYKSGMLPRQSGDAIIEAGVRQTIIDQKFKTDVVKYDYMIFGLVDVKISYDPASNSGPAISSVGPVGTIDGSSATISAQTDRQSSCKFDREDVVYSSMKYAFSNSSAGNFSQKVCGLESGNYTFYVRCKNDAGNENNVSKIIQFSISR